MKDSRVGETLWSEWTGSDHSPVGSSAIVFFTEGHVDVYHEVVRRALASAIQRDGSVDSLSDAFKLLESCTTTYGYAGEVDGDNEYTSCDKDGMTIYGDEVDKVLDITWVEFNG